MRIIFCLPGRKNGPQYSGNFLLNWSELVKTLISNDIDYAISQQYSSNVYYARTLCLGGDVRFGVDQKPFRGEVEYDYIMWIDSDIEFTVYDFQTIFHVAQEKKLDILSGIYKTGNQEDYACVENWDNSYFKAHGCFEFWNDKILEERENQIIPVSYNGMGFMLVRKGVFEAVGYPWFRPEWQTYGHVQDFSSEDVSFCLNAQRKGYKVYVHTGVKLGHDKSLPIR